MYYLYLVGKEQWPALRRRPDPNLDRFPVRCYESDIEAVLEMQRLTERILASPADEESGN
jgi:hypothetical protein